MKTTCPCKGCVNRELGCHGKCASYAEYKNRIAEFAEIRKNAKIGDYRFSPAFPDRSMYGR